ncbi:DUF6807 domain-containing protein [Pedobacter insulae]|uniref:Methane oxygenase PmoA n=1 Tax=Pedobacter insulae TaxID=414048 RepID=A0A1I2TN52_9SPHI|nr:PmoA family protein [Pedobacter insulae]SFG66350.1 Methane oxygenase PmoA [Pedobacter insulae]
MKFAKPFFAFLFCATSTLFAVHAQVKLTHHPTSKKVDITIGDKLFTSFQYPDNIEKPFLYPVFTVNQTDVTRGFPLNPKPGDPTDHPHHIGIWLNYENVNGLDFWNNSYAIPLAKKDKYGWIKTDKIIELKNGKKGSLTYHANWINKNSDILLEEHTKLEFSTSGRSRIIDRTTTLTAVTEVIFSDVKDGFLGMRLAHELQIPTKQDQKFTDDKGNVTIVKGGTDKVANGNYLSSEGKIGDEVWSSRAHWVKAFGKMGSDSVSVTIIDHPKNVNYPTYWHARGYGLFAANPLGEKIFSNGARTTNLKLAKGEKVNFKYRIVIDAGKNSTSTATIKNLVTDFYR